MIGVMLTLSGCSWFSSKPPPPTPLQVAQEAAEKSRIANEVLKKNYATPQVQWTFAAKAIELRLTASAGLNFYDGEPHSLVISVYQLSDPNQFNSFRVSRDKLTEIMDTYRFDPSVTAFDQIFLQPGEQPVVRLDRAEKTRFVAIVAGYYQTDPDQSTRLFEIPVKVTPGSTEPLATPGILYVNIFAGDSMIQQFGSN
jgi:type VI secretion system VasD/TssJ family lipoprotein